LAVVGLVVEEDDGETGELETPFEEASDDSGHSAELAIII
jgi:hypothetical protein